MDRRWLMTDYGNREEGAEEGYNKIGKWAVLHYLLNDPWIWIVVRDTLLVHVVSENVEGSSP
jgi:hypothetical protein